MGCTQKKGRHEIETNRGEMRESRLRICEPRAGRAGEFGEAQ